MGRQLGSPHSWQSRELRNPLMDMALPPTLALSPRAALGVQSLANLAQQAALGGRRPVAGVMLLYGPHLLWSSLPPRDTAALFSLLATGLLHASSSSGGKGVGAGALSHSGAGGVSGAQGGTAPSDLRPLDGGAWQQLPSGFLVQRGSGNGSAEGPPEVQPVSVPVVHLQHQPADQQTQQAQQAGAQEQPAAGSSSATSSVPADSRELHPCHLLPLLEGKLLVALLLGGGTRLLTPPLLGGLHALLAGPAKQLAAEVGWAAWGRRCPVVWSRNAPPSLAPSFDPFSAYDNCICYSVAHPPSTPRLARPCRPGQQVGEELRASRAEAAHLPGFRYLFQDVGQQVARASPRTKVSAMSHHARTMAAAVRGSLGALPAGAAGGVAAKDAGGGPAGDAASPAEGGSPVGDQEVLEVLAKSSQECWAAAWRPGDGRQLLVVRERRSERDPAEAAEVMQAFASSHFHI